MAFLNALNMYRRADTVEVDCGTFSVELRSYQSLYKELGDEKVRLRSEGILPAESVTPQPRKRKTTTAARMQGVDAAATGDNIEFILGSKERDQRFFAEHVLVNWKGLKDDDGVEVPYSADAAMELFNSPGGDELYSELLVAALDPMNFVDVKSLTEDAKN